MFFTYKLSILCPLNTVFLVVLYPSLDVTFPVLKPHLMGTTPTPSLSIKISRILDQKTPLKLN